MKHLQTYNESIRDKMTPVSDEELEDAYSNVFREHAIPLNEYGFDPEETPGEFKQISKKVGEPLDKLYFISEEESREFARAHDYFSSLLNKLSDEEYDIVYKTKKDSFYGDWYCYPDIPLAYWYDDDATQAWIFSEKTFKNND